VPVNSSVMGKAERIHLTCLFIGVALTARLHYETLQSHLNGLRGPAEFARLTAMKPKFANLEAWKQAELLMQPAFIRLVDNLRKQLDESTWKGAYRDVPLWADDVPESTRTRYQLLQQELTTAAPTQAVLVEAALAQLPAPHPGYELCLTQPDRQVVVDMWELCYQICFHAPARSDAPVTVDLSLIDETGEVDWAALDEKTKAIVGQIFANLAIDRSGFGDAPREA
jgi:hypothetical protein